MSDIHNVVCNYVFFSMEIKKKSFKREHNVILKKSERGKKWFLCIDFFLMRTFSKTLIRFKVKM